MCIRDSIYCDLHLSRHSRGISLVVAHRIAHGIRAGFSDIAAVHLDPGSYILSVFIGRLVSRFIELVAEFQTCLLYTSNLKVIYPDPDLVNIVPNTSLAELRLTRAPSNLIELAYHDNLEDALWIVNNIDLIARTLVLSLTEYFEIPFNDPY